MFNYLTDNRDRTVFSQTPVLLQPRFGEPLNPPEPGAHRFLCAEEGLFIEARNEVIELRVPVAKSSITLPFGRIVDRGINLVHGPVPNEILQTVIERSIQAMPNEWAGLVLWDRKRKRYVLFEPETLSSSPAHISYMNIVPQECDVVLDLHSHGRLSAFFSEADNYSDRPGFYIAGVVGHCDSENMTFQTRLVVNGHFLYCTDFRRLFG